MHGKGDGSLDCSNYFYNYLTYSEKDLSKYCGEDELQYMFYRKKLERLEFSPKLVGHRYYHVFHEFPKDFREKVLRLDGKRIKEVFDVRACDLHMLASALESASPSIPCGELLKFQKAVKGDIRKQFDRYYKLTGKLKKSVKTAFKVYLNSKKSYYEHIKPWTYCKEIDTYFQENFPNIREYIVNHDIIWKDLVEKEFETVSKGEFNDLKRMGIKALTCHDAIYVKVDDQDKLPDMTKLFYRNLRLAVDIQDLLEEL